MSIRIAASAAFFGIFVAFAAPVAQAQCGTDDGFIGPCCAPVTPVFPVFPTMTVGGKSAALLDCNPQCVWNTTNTIAPFQVLCDYWVFSLSITGTAADPSIPAATLFGKYVRTWMELSPTGPIQVWRWLINTDATYVVPASVPPSLCQVPFSALPPFNLPVHLQGHLDYAQHCGTGSWNVAFSLTHLCPFESHAPFSARPLVLPAGLPARTYHFVAPGNFVFGPVPAPAGPILADAQRTTQLVPYQCISENPIVQGSLNTSFQDCICTNSTVLPPPVYSHQNLFATVANCGVVSTLASLPIPGILPTGFRHLGIGAWIVTATSPLYPGPETVGFYTGVVTWTDLCPPPGPGFHIINGVGNVGGYPRLPFSGTPGLIYMQAVDIGNILLFPSFAAGIGALHIVSHVWSMNMP
jgi:hypothetical protein